VEALFTAKLMDAQQIKLYVVTNISSKENLDDRRVALELDHFIDALQNQLINFHRDFTPEQIEQAWQNWKLERFQYIQQAKGFTLENKASLLKLTNDWLNKNVPNRHTDRRLSEESKTFAEAYALKMENLSIEPLPEHIDIAWSNWLKGFRY
jgi:hypothetical protein